MSKNTTNAYRSLIKKIDARPTSDGDGVKIKRSLTPGRAASFDPFLLLDEIYSDQAADYIGGFPEHPHRGFETVTYMLAGAMKHRDHLGNEGRLIPGSVQWMTAGKGIIHSEMPEQEEGLLHGFQLWVNLPAAEKMSAPNYQEFRPDQIPEVSLPSGNHVKVIAGSFSDNDQTITGPVTGISTAPDYLDIQLAPNAPLDIKLDSEKTTFLYVYQGKLGVLTDSDQVPELSAGQLGLFGTGQRIALRSIQENSRALLIAGYPLREPVAHWGPFVMNNQEQVEQAINDYQQGRLI